MNRFEPDQAEWIQGSGYSKLRIFDEKQLRCRGALFQTVKILPGQSVDPHHHLESVEIFHMISGRGHMAINNEVISLQPGDTILCEPGDIHDAHNPNQEDWIYLVFKTNSSPQDTYWD